APEVRLRHPQGAVLQPDRHRPDVARRGTREAEDPRSRRRNGAPGVRVRSQQAGHLDGRVAGLLRRAEQELQGLPFAADVLHAGCEAHARLRAGTRGEAVIAIVDYGLGNVRAFANIYDRLGIAATLARSADDLGAASRIVLPGVGAFDWAMSRLEQSGMRAALDDVVLRGGKPVLGICVGMQMMARRSDEWQAAGLGWFDAGVRRFDPARFDGPACLPHMGWNDVGLLRAHRLFSDLD